jgi:IS5 family transposase
MSHQITFLSLGSVTKRTRADRFLDEMNRVVPWGELTEVISPHYREKGTGRPLTEVGLLLRLHCLQLWYNLSDPGLEDAVHDRLSFQRFLGLDPLNQRVPDETTVLHFRRVLEKHGLAERIFEKVNERLAGKGLLLKGGTIVDATILSAPSSTKNREGKRDPGMSSTQKNGQWHFGMKAHIGVDAKSGLVHTVKTTTASVHDSEMFSELTHGEEMLVAGDSAYANQMLKVSCRQAGVLYLIAESLEKSWRTGLALIRHYQETKQDDAMYEKTKEYAAAYPGNDMIGLKYAAAMLRQKKYRECTDYLAHLNVLPNEGAYEGRTVYRNAWLFCALENVQAGKYREAISDVEQSERWPEHLGVGKPYDEDIDLSIENFITEYCNAKLNGVKPPQLVATSNSASDEIAKETVRVCR